MDPLLAAAVGFVTAAVLAALGAWLTARGKVAEEVRQGRHRTYPEAWKRTAVVSFWPRPKADCEAYRVLHEGLRDWYYDCGGLYLSSRARKRHEHLQKVLAAVLGRPDEDPECCYDVVRDAASYYRTGLAGDLETRALRGAWTMFREWRDDRRADRRATERLDVAKRARCRKLAQQG